MPDRELGGRLNSSDLKPLRLPTSSLDGACEIQGSDDPVFRKLHTG